MENFNNIFNIIYKKYHAKDYFAIKECLRNKLL